MRLPLIHTLLLLSLVAGCGGSPSRTDQHRPGTGEQRPRAKNESGERDGGASRLPKADQLAFIAVGTASGAVRARAALIAEGHSERRGARRSTARARQVLARAHPQDPELIRLRHQTLAAIDETARLPDPHTARALLTATDTINAGLRHYAQRHPAIGGVIPD
jgi:hypothetical protein